MIISQPAPHPPALVCLWGTGTSTPLLSEVSPVTACLVLIST